MAGKGGARPIAVERRHAEGCAGGINGAIPEQGLPQVEAKESGEGGLEPAHAVVGAIAVE